MTAKKSTTKRTALKTKNVMSRYIREQKCPYCGKKCALEFEVTTKDDDPYTAVREISTCVHLSDYDKFYFYFLKEGWTWDD